MLFPCTTSESGENSMFGVNAINSLAYMWCFEEFGTICTILKKW